MKDTLANLLLLVKARYPLVQLLSYEEERVERGLERLGGPELIEHKTRPNTQVMIRLMDLSSGFLLLTYACFTCLPQTSASSPFPSFRV